MAEETVNEQIPAEKGQVEGVDGAETAVQPQDSPLATNSTGEDKGDEQEKKEGETDVNAANGNAKVNKPTKNLSIAPKPASQPTPSDDPSPIHKESKDYAKIYDKYQERFQKVYDVSQKLFMMERAQRQTMNHYQRRNHALLDLLDQVEPAKAGSNDDELLSEGDKSRIENLVELNPRLKTTLAPLLALDDPSKNIKIKNTYKINMLLHENIPELINDDLDLIEVNPQDSDVWVRRNHPNLVFSKYKPIDLKPTGVQEHYEHTPPVTRRKKKMYFVEPEANKKAKT